MIVLDTPSLAWWVSGDARLAATAKALIEDSLTSNAQVLVSAISAWGLATLVQRGRMALAMELNDWLRDREHRRRCHRADHRSRRGAIGELAG